MQTSTFELSQDELLEKPMVGTIAQANDLIRISREKSLVGVVDHTFLYTDAVKALKDFSLKDNFGDKLYYDSTRINLGLIQNDINVLWDLAVHDIYILDFLLNGETPNKIDVNSHKKI